MVRKLLLNRSKSRQVQLKLVGFIFTENSNTVQKHRKALTKTSALGRFRLFKMQWIFGFAFNRSGLFYL